MNIAEIDSIESLKALGTVTELREQLQEIVLPLKIEADSYEDLFKVVLLLQEKWADVASSPFVSRKAEVIFYLTKLEGEKRNELLGLTKAHFSDQDLAKKWYRSLRQLTHSDRNGGNDEAFIALEKLYNMVNYAGDDDE